MSRSQTSLFFWFGFEERFEQNWFHFGQVSSTTNFFFFKQLSFLHLTLNFLVRYWSRFSKVFRKFFRSIAYISNQKDQSFWKVFRKFFGKFFRSIGYISNQKDQSFWKVFGKFLANVDDFFVQEVSAFSFPLQPTFFSLSNFLFYTWH